MVGIEVFFVIRHFLTAGAPTIQPDLDHTAAGVVPDLDLTRGEKSNEGGRREGRKNTFEDAGEIFEDHGEGMRVSDVLRERQGGREAIVAAGDVPVLLRHALRGMTWRRSGFVSECRWRGQEVERDETGHLVEPLIVV
jgi:hypothetical protein